MCFLSLQHMCSRKGTLLTLILEKKAHSMINVRGDVKLILVREVFNGEPADTTGRRQSPQSRYERQHTAFL